LVLNWTIAQPGVTAALVGARDAAQAKENAKATNFKLAKEDLDKIDQMLQTLEPAKRGA
jgi:aryl-alcohol dehydrogenase-like predicted oxidoreductase